MPLEAKVMQAEPGLLSSAFPKFLACFPRPCLESNSAQVKLKREDITI